MLDVVDSYFEYVAGRMVTINPIRQMVGVSDAMDWPVKNVVLEAFYLLVLGQRAAGSKAFWSPTVSVFTHALQWTWIIAGTDLTQGKVGRSRGDRYRTNMTMREELVNATYPWFAQKQTWAVIGSTPAGLALQGTPVVPSEQIWWTPPTFQNRVDEKSGLIYGSATVQVTAMEPAVLA